MMHCYSRWPILGQTSPEFPFSIMNPISTDIGRFANERARINRSKLIGRRMLEALEPLRPFQLLSASAPNGRAKFANKDFGRELRIVRRQVTFLRDRSRGKEAAGAGYSATPAENFQR